MSGAGLSSTGCAGHLCWGVPPPPFHLCRQKCLCWRKENKFRQNQFPDPSCSRIVPSCFVGYRKEVVQGQEQLGILVALVCGLFCLRAYVELLTWLFVAAQICSCCWGKAVQVVFGNACCLSKCRVFLVFFCMQ